MGFIEKRIEKYYVNKLEEFISQNMLAYIVDKKFIDEGSYIRLKVKRYKYNAEEYKTIFFFRKDEALKLLCNQERVIEILDNRVKKYLSMERD